MEIKAYAKINLALDVLGTRPNGYHDVRMIMQSVNIYDELTIDISNTPGTISLICDNDELNDIENNLIYKAAKLILNESKNNTGLSITLKKNIPMAAGMAGGSADAAATLVGINKLLNIGMSNMQLRDLAVTLGADIPFCIEGGTYLSEGIGEILTKLPNAPECFLCIAKPDINVSTKYVYEHLILDDNTVHPNVDAMIESINNHNQAAVSAALGNILETVTQVKYPIISKMKETMIANGAANALMSGSGPTVFGIYANEKDACNALEALRKQYDFKQGFVTTLSNFGVSIV
ncbi:MAG: 4-(cytidine 5'-diphospho)-2-C-methyl-D-erythritol kinase [Lachnospiraceae bacterium]|nr:4-(cytidine 5'-diphospho)-2-C-methyl-D-erythritol kinase [Candidatus Colinaster equi]